MRVWTCTDHDGHNPVGTASVVVAFNKEDAMEWLRFALNEQGLDGDRGFTLKELNLDKAGATVLRDGDY